MSDSASASESCCVDTLCNCEAWLTSFCDYVTVSLEYCGETTTFDRARFSGMPMESVNSQSGVHPSDGVFRVSTYEHSVDIGLGAVITDAEGTEWTVYKVQSLNQFCVKKLWARSVSACFQLLDKIEIFELDCSDCGDCEDLGKLVRVGKVSGKILSEAGTLRSQNNSNEIVYRYSGELVRWPLSKMPTSRHRIKTKNASYRIIGVRDAGPLVPFYLTLEQESADCTLRG